MSKFRVPEGPSPNSNLPCIAQKPVLRGNVRARALRVRSVSREGAWASAGVQGAWVGGRGYEANSS